MISSEFLGKKINSEASKLLLTNNIGGFLLFTPYAFSKYQGLFFKEDKTVFKAIEEIQLTQKTELQEIKHNFQCFTNVYREATEEYYLPVGKNSLLYKNQGQQVSIILDSRKADDFSSWGRYYEISKEKGIILIKYIKKNDPQEQNQDEYEFYTAIKADDSNFNKIDNWQEKIYPFDSARNDSCKRYVYNSISIKSNKIGFGFSKDKSKAIKLAMEVYNTSESVNQQSSKPSVSKIKIKETEIDYAYNLSTYALKSLRVLDKENGIYAGLPWFHQFWTRDTALSAKAFSLIREKELIKEVLFNLLNSAGKDGLIPNRTPHSDLNSIDGSGLVINRIGELIDSLSDSESRKIKEKVKEVALNILTFHSRENMIYSNPYESWMDTDIRSGFLIEIQALQLSMYSTLKALSKKSKDTKLLNFISKIESDLKYSVVSNFFVNGDLKDSLNSNLKRPNVFLAYYFYPELLNDKQWKMVFDKHLGSLYLDWGGLSTLDVSNQYFQPNHTGMNNTSYHKGDSWFFINNIAAICLYRLDSKKYKKYVDQILKASTNDILNKGIFGFSSELSSASHQEANGCLAQLWSSATYVELIQEIYGK